MLPAVELAISVATFAAAATAGARGIWESVRGILAKKAAQKVLADKTATDKQLRDVLVRFNEGRPDVQMTAQTIKEHLVGELPQKDLDRIDKGLSQPSKSAERRYIEDLISTSVLPDHR